jgi:hypothetical protein
MRAAHLSFAPEIKSDFRYQALSETSILVCIFPATPSSATDTAVLHVTTMDNGSQIAQTLQSLGGTGSLIDVSSVTLTSGEKSAIGSFISSGGATTTPARVTVAEADAVVNAMANLVNLPTKAPPAGLNSLLSGKVIVHTGVLSARFTSGGWSGQDVKLPNNEITYFKDNGETWVLCINSAWLDTTHTNTSGQTCSQAGIYKQGTWTTAGQAANDFRSTDDSNTNFNVTVSLKDINASHGFYTNTGTVNVSPVSTFTGQGEYVFMSSTWNKSYLAGTTYYVGGHDQCVDGVGQFVYNSDATQYSQTCRYGRVDSGANTPATGTLSNVTGIPGLAKLSVGGVDRYIGVSVGSTPARGRSIMIYPGNTNCGTGGGKSLSDCGYVRYITYSNT